MEQSTVISTKDIFHFTKSIDNLKSIINNGFRVQFSKEELILINGSKYKNWAIPMVCFCDIPFNLTKNHIDIYGGYGIGISKLLGNTSMKLNPVIYLEDSSLKISFEDLVKHIIIDGNCKEIGVSTYNILKFIKKYKGDYCKNGMTYSEYKFYDEREWRYVPPFTLTKNFISEDEFDSIEKENIQILENNGYISFDINDINYIIVKDKQEIAEMSEFIKSKVSSFDIKKINTIDRF